MLTQLKQGAKVAGAKQARRALQDGRAKALFLARNADPDLTQPLEQLAQDHQVPVCWIDTMAELGRACGIAVGAAVAALL